MTRLRRMIPGFAAICALLTGCGNAELAVLQAERVASIELSAASDTRTIERAAETSLGIPSPAVVQRTYVPQALDDLPELFADAVNAVEQSGWELQPDSSRENYLIGTKAVDAGSIELAVYVSNDEVVIIDLQLRP